MRLFLALKALENDVDTSFRRVVQTSLARMIIFFSCSSLDWRLGLCLFLVSVFLDSNSTTGVIWSLKRLMNSSWLSSGVSYTTEGAWNWVSAFCLLSFCIVLGVLKLKAAQPLRNWLSSSFAFLASWYNNLDGNRHAQGNRVPGPTIEAMASSLQKLPTDIHCTEQDLNQCSVHELKERLNRIGIALHDCVEKHDMVCKLLSYGGSSATSCGICCEDYEQGDAVRVLPCKHRFHIECIDKWLYSLTDRSRPPACPLCNSVLKVT